MYHPPPPAPAKTTIHLWQTNLRCSKWKTRSFKAIQNGFSVFLCEKNTVDFIWNECLWSFLQKRPNHPVCLHPNSRRRLFPPDQVNSTISWLLIDNTLPPIKITSKTISMSPPSNLVSMSVSVCWWYECHYHHHHHHYHLWLLFVRPSVRRSVLPIRHHNNRWFSMSLSVVIFCEIDSSSSSCCFLISIWNRWAPHLSPHHWRLWQTDVSFRRSPHFPFILYSM